MIKLNVEQTDRFFKEMHLARESKIAGQAGRMRVCVRRAAGILTAAWMSNNNITAQFSDVYRTFEYLLPLMDEKPEIQSILSHLILRVDESYQFPEEIDLTKDVLRLAELFEIDLQRISP